MCLFFLVPACTYGSSKQHSLEFNAIDKLVQSRLPAVAPGAVVLVAKNDKIIFEKAYGKANLQTKQVMRPDMVFRIGSITKEFTAVAILQLVEQGRISLQDTVQRFVRAFPSKPYPITIQNLLSLTSGIVNYQSIEHPDPAKVREDYSPAQGVDYFKDEPLNFKPGSQFEYSNSNHYLLGYIIERVTGKSYRDYLEEHIFRPAGLTHTYYIDSTEKNLDMATGYSRFDRKHWEKATLQNVTHLYAAGALLSTAEDLFKWHLALNAGKVLSIQSVNTAFAPVKFPGGSYSEYTSLGILRQLDGSITREHNGSTDGYQCDEIYLPQEGVFVVTLFNGFEQDMDWITLSNDIARIAAGKPLKQVLQLDAEVLKRYAGTYRFNNEHQLIVTYKNHQLFVEATNPKDRLPRVQLFAKTVSRFYIKEAALEFEFTDGGGGNVLLTTYNSAGKDADWKKLNGN